jgi:small neutral amino acid transporter SnatA (MarC family)
VSSGAAVLSPFLALFVAIDIVGVLPVYLGLVSEPDAEARRRITVEATLIAGPAVLTSVLTLVRSHGYPLMLVAFGLNLTWVWFALRWALVLVRVLGEAGSRAVANVFRPLVAAIGVTFIRHGLEQALIGP